MLLLYQVRDNSLNLEQRRRSIVKLAEVGESLRSSKHAAEVKEQLRALLDDDNEFPQLKQDAYRVLGLFVIDEDTEELNYKLFVAILDGEQSDVENLIEKVDKNHVWTVKCSYDPKKKELQVKYPPPPGTDTNRTQSPVSLKSREKSSRKTGRPKRSRTYLSEEALESLNTKEFRECSWLVIAALCGNRKIVNFLLQMGISPFIEYKYTRGLQSLQWQGNAAFAACCTGNLKLLKVFLENDKDGNLLSSRIKIQGDEGGDLLWEAAYFGHYEIVEHLILIGGDHKDHHDPIINDRSVKCCDNANYSHSVPHIAALGGSDDHCAVLRVLIDNGADVETVNKYDISPLEDAIALGHANIVQLLVENDQLFPTYEDRKDHDRIEHLRRRNAAALFRQDNELVIAAAAKGLVMASEDQVKKLVQPEYNQAGEKHLLVKFLRTIGDAPMYIMEAIFRRRTLVYKELAHEDLQYPLS
jgi:hypothetical protein